MKLLGTPPETKKSSLGAFALKFDNKVCHIFENGLLLFILHLLPSHLISFAIRKSMESERSVLEKKQHGNYLDFTQWLRYAYRVIWYLEETDGLVEVIEFCDLVMKCNCLNIEDCL